MTETNPNLLIVEGIHEKFTIPEIIEKAGVPWSKPYPVELHAAQGVQEILTSGAIETWVKESGRTAVGIIVDADDNPSGRWQSLTHHCAPIAQLPDKPASFQTTALVAGRDIAFGVWMMPNCHGAGMLEDLLIPLFQPDVPALHTHVENFIDQGKVLGAGYNVAHRSKALLAALIALEEPGEAAWRNKVLAKMTLTDPSLTPFVDWFRTLFSV